MEIRFSKKGSTLIVAFSGELDHHFAEYARNRIESELLKATTRDVIFDLTGLSFMDSSGIGVLVGRYANIRRLGGKAAVICRNRRILKILEMSGVLKLMSVYDKPDDALRALPGA
ncbi:MAG: anti-sigma factor antagonist [Clostridiaceae bacterium]|nr:anti-sigma factor antagonist [Clostridiaceae bacterium]